MISSQSVAQATSAAVEGDPFDADKVIEHGLLFFHRDLALVELRGPQIQALEHGPIRARGLPFLGEVGTHQFAIWSFELFSG